MQKLNENKKKALNPFFFLRVPNKHYEKYKFPLQKSLLIRTTLKKIRKLEH